MARDDEPDKPLGVTKGNDKPDGGSGVLAGPECNFEGSEDCNFESNWLDRLAKKCIIFLAVTTLLSFVSGTYLLNTGETDQIWAIVLIGASGSAVAALTSCLNRFANGFEDERGHPHPKDETTKERFNRRMSAWMFMRPILGAVVAPVFIWGLAILIPTSQARLLPGSNADSAVDLATVGFTAFMAGLLAKSVLAEIKKLFDRLFGGQAR